jgi:hypothetical protein
MYCIPIEALYSKNIDPAHVNIKLTIYSTRLISTISRHVVKSLKPGPNRAVKKCHLLRLTALLQHSLAYTYVTSRLQTSPLYPPQPPFFWSTIINAEVIARPSNSTATSMADAELRQRKAAGPASDDTRPKSSEPEPKPKSRRRLEDDDEYSPWVDILRVLSFLLVASCGLSYVISGGESLFWGMKDKPQYLRVGWWKSQFVR